MAISFALPDPRRLRSYVVRMPLATRVLLFIIIALYGAVMVWPGLEQWGALIPSEMGLASLYRLNTFPLLHTSIFHLLFNVVSLTPLLERFEAEHGTVVTAALFSGPFGLIPGLLYTGIEKWILRRDTAAAGASIWVFLLLASEAVRAWKAHPWFAAGDVRIPVWCTPLVAVVVIAVLLPGSSLLGHLCGVAVGYLWGFGYIRFLAPPDRVLRWIETKLNLLGRIPHYVSVDQKTYGRYGVLPSANTTRAGSSLRPLSPANGVPLAPVTVGGQRLGP